MSLLKISTTSSANSLLSEATTKAVGTRTETSSAWLGPDKTPILELGNSSLATSSSVFKDDASKPLEQIITPWSLT